MIIHLLIAALLTDVAVDLGTPSVVLPNGAHGLYYFADEPISVVSKNPLRYLVVAGERTFLMGGNSFETSKPITRPLDPSKVVNRYDENYTGISSIYQSGTEIIGFFHAEKHFKEKNEDGIPLYYSHIGLAVSRDGGLTFDKVGPILSGAPYDPDHKYHQGVGDVSVCAIGEWLYAYYTSADRRGSFTCLARSKIKDRGMPGSWQKYFNRSFDEPGLGGQDSKVVQCWGPNVVHVPEAKKYLLLGGKGNDGILLFFSDDGVQWSSGQVIWNIVDYPKKGCEIATHPTILVSKASATKIEGMMYFGYSPSWGTESPDVPHFLVKRPIRIDFEKESSKKTNPSIKSIIKSSKKQRIRS